MAKRHDEASIWERMGGESAEAYAAFSLYRDMAYQTKDANGNEKICDVPVCRRSIRAVAKKLGKSEGLLERWSSNWDWGNRVEAYDRFIDEEALRKATSTIASMRARHITMAKMMTVTGYQAMQAKKPEDIFMKDAIKLMVSGMEIEAERMRQEVEAHTPAEHTVTEQETLRRLDDVLAQIMDDATAEKTEET